MTLLQVFNVMLILNFIYMCEPSDNCIPRSNISEIEHCCKMEQLVPPDVYTQCEEAASVNHNPGSLLYELCQHNCMYETLGGINGFDIDLSKLQHLTDAFPSDFQDVARMALEDCTTRLRCVMEEIKQVNSPCSPLGRMVQICLDTTIFENCPTSRWTASIACNKHRSGIAYC